MLKSAVNQTLSVIVNNKVLAVIGTAFNYITVHIIKYRSSLNFSLFSQVVKELMPFHFCKTSVAYFCMAINILIIRIICYIKNLINSTLNIYHNLGFVSQQCYITQHLLMVSPDHLHIQVGCLITNHWTKFLILPLFCMW